MQLIINTFGSSLRKQDEQFVVQAGDKSLSLSAHKVQSIVVTTAVHLTSDAIGLAVANNIGVLFLNREGDPIARVWQTRMGPAVTIHCRQLEAVCFVGNHFFRN